MKDVDWNIERSKLFSVYIESSFVWRMWIEIGHCLRNGYTMGSSFVWRMWIEIESVPQRQPLGDVILRMKDVDWNSAALLIHLNLGSHPSYEGCGLKSRRVRTVRSPTESSFVWRMWIEILRYTVKGRRIKSSFVWRMWIEISSVRRLYPHMRVILRMKDVDWNRIGDIRPSLLHGHPSYEGCGLKCLRPYLHTAFAGHPSYEGCGLKFGKTWMCCGCHVSSFVWRMWIEMIYWNAERKNRSHPSYEGCGLKCPWSCIIKIIPQSSFVWRMWIEIFRFLSLSIVPLVILRMKDVDWNFCKIISANIISVILRMKDVDWNKISSWKLKLTLVILRMKDVDWNSELLMIN